MSGFISTDQVFMRKLTEIIQANLADENFGVDELARALGMSRSSVYRRLFAISKKSTTQLIRELRLQRAMEMLRQEGNTVSEIAYQVGFGSPSYFNTCFHEYFGFPPGEVLRNGGIEPAVIINSNNTDLPGKENTPAQIRAKDPKWKLTFRNAAIAGGIGLLCLIGLAYLLNVKVLKSPTNYSIDSLKNSDKSIVVLPFTNQSNDPNVQGIADWIMEDIINNLNEINDLTVIPRTSVEQFRNTSLSAPEIGKKINANFILEGSVLQYEGKIRVHVRLINARQDNYIPKNILSGKEGMYDISIEDIPSIINSIAKLVASNLQTVLTPMQIEAIKENPTNNLDANRNYLMGLYLYNMRTTDEYMFPNDYEKSQKYFENAIRIDPGFSKAYAGLADLYFTKAWWGRIPRLEGYKKALEYANRALELDKNLTEAYTVLGRLCTFNEKNWERARERFKKAIELDPKYPYAHANYSELLDILGENDSARYEINQAITLDPTIRNFYRLSSVYFFNEGKLKKALEELDKMAENMSEPKRFYYWQRFYIYDRMGDDVSALEALKKIAIAEYQKSNYPAMIDDIYKMSGMTGIYNKLLEISLQEHNTYASLAQLYARLGKKDEAIACLQKSLDNREVRLPYINNDPRCVYIRREPGFKKIIEELGLGKYFNPSKDFAPVAH